jgi:hypothetical protein
MREVRCKNCFQEIPARVSLCPRCGYTDGVRVGKAIGHLLLYVSGTLLAAALAFWSGTR